MTVIQHSMTLPAGFLHLTQSTERQKQAGNERDWEAIEYEELKEMKKNKERSSENAESKKQSENPREIYNNLYEIFGESGDFL